MGTEFLVVLPAGIIVDNTDVMTAVRKVEGCRPPQISITTENEDSHDSTASRSSLLGAPEVDLYRAHLFSLLTYRVPPEPLDQPARRIRTFRGHSNGGYAQ